MNQSAIEPTDTTISQPKTTMKESPSQDSERLGSILNIKHREVELQCEKHGLQKIKQISVFHEFPKPKCELCEAERETARKAREEARERIERIEMAIVRSGIPLRFKNKTLDDFEVANDKMQICRTACAEYLANFPELKNKGTGMVFSGSTGTGKTHLACSLGMQIIQRHMASVFYITAPELFRVVKQSFGGTDSDVLRRYNSPQLLIIDEIGASYGTDAEKTILFELVNQRYETLKPTILISNLALKGLLETAGERVMDRMKENGGLFLTFGWPSHRAG